MQGLCRILDQNAHTLPAGLTLKAANVFPPRVTPYRFTERRDGSIVVSGYVTRRRTGRRSWLWPAALPVAGDVVDNLNFATSPGRLGRCRDRGRAGANRLAGGHADLVDQSVSVAGTAFQDAAPSISVRRCATACDGIPRGERRAHSMEPGNVDASACRDQLQSVLRIGRIESTRTTPSSPPTASAARSAAGVILRCPDADIDEIGVHSDNDEPGRRCATARSPSRYHR